jgi:hypothetical protein
MASEGEAVMLQEQTGTDEMGAPILDLDDLMKRLRAEVEARKGQPATTSAQINHSIDALLAMPDAEFVTAAYHSALDRAPSAHEASGSLNRLLLGRVTRTGLLREFVDSKEGRGRGARVDDLAIAEQRERASRGAVARLFLDIRNGLRTLYLLPRRIGQFVRRVDALEGKLADANLRLDALQQEVAVLKSSVGQAFEVSNAQ